MAYNNGFPMGYQPMYFPQQYSPAPQVVQTQQQQISAQQPQIQQPVNNGIIWVQGEAGAKSYLVAPNTTVQLWDSENQVIYLKSADASGVPSIKTLDYTIREMKQSHAPAMAPQPSVYATKEDLDALRSEVESMLASRKAPVKAVRKEADENG